MTEAEERGDEGVMRRMGELSKRSVWRVPVQSVLICTIVSTAFTAIPPSAPADETAPATRHETKGTVFHKPHPNHNHYIIDHLLSKGLLAAARKRYGEENWRQKLRKDRLELLPYYFGWMEKRTVKVKGNRVSLKGQHGCYAEFIQVGSKYFLHDFGQRITSM